MDKIANMSEIKDVEPMVFPFAKADVSLREDEVTDYLTVDEVLANTSASYKDQVKVPKVVSE